MTHERKLGEVFTDKECGELVVVNEYECSQCVLNTASPDCGAYKFGPCTSSRRTDRTSVAFVSKDAYLRFKLTGEWG